MGLFEQLTLPQKYILQEFLWLNSIAPSTEVSAQFVSHSAFSGFMFDNDGYEYRGWQAAHLCPVCSQPRPSDAGGNLLLCASAECAEIREFYGITIKRYPEGYADFITLVPHPSKEIQSRRGMACTLFATGSKKKVFIRNLTFDQLKQFKEYYIKTAPLREEQKFLRTSIAEAKTTIKGDVHE